MQYRSYNDYGYHVEPVESTSANTFHQRLVVSDFPARKNYMRYSIGQYRAQVNIYITSHTAHDKHAISLTFCRPTSRRVRIHVRVHNMLKLRTNTGSTHSNHRSQRPAILAEARLEISLSA